MTKLQPGSSTSRDVWQAALRSSLAVPRGRQEAGPELILAASAKSEPVRDRHVSNGVASRDCEASHTIARRMSMTAAAITKSDVRATRPSAGTELDQLCINTIRTLAMDAVQQAKSGHPGTPMALAPLAYVIWQHFLRFDPDPSSPIATASCCPMDTSDAVVRDPPSGRREGGECQI